MTHRNRLPGFSVRMPDGVTSGQWYAGGLGAEYERCRTRANAWAAKVGGTVIAGHWRNVKVQGDGFGLSACRMTFTPAA